MPSIFPPRDFDLFELASILAEWAILIGHIWKKRAKPRL